MIIREGIEQHHPGKVESFHPSGQSIQEHTGRLANFMIVIVIMVIIIIIIIIIVIIVIIIIVIIIIIITITCWWVSPRKGESPVVIRLFS